MSVGLAIRQALERKDGPFLTLHSSLEQLAREWQIPGRFAAAIRSWDPTIAEYKGKQMFADVVLPYL